MTQTSTSLAEDHESLCSEALHLMVRKNQDYTGVSNDPFFNFKGSLPLGIHPVMGILLRMQDKMQRVRSYAERGSLSVHDEGVRDSIIDLINYSVLMYGLVKESDAKTN